MTDKEKIIAEIELRIKIADTIHERKELDDMESISACIASRTLENLLLFINSLSEEPKFKVGDNIEPT